MIRVSVREAPFDVGAEMRDLAHEAVGGLGCFVGVVRGTSQADARDGNSLVALTLEHYPAMTERAIARIAGEASHRFDLLGCTVIHRVGRLAVGEPIVLVLAAAAHRRAALDGTGFLIDWLKTGAPFWKCQEFADGSRLWVEQRQADEAASARWDRAETL